MDSTTNENNEITMLENYKINYSENLKKCVITYKNSPQKKRNAYFHKMHTMQSGKQQELRFQLIFPLRSHFFSGSDTLLVAFIYRKTEVQSLLAVVFISLSSTDRSSSAADNPLSSPFL